MWLVQLALRRPYSVAVLALVMLLLGGFAVKSMHRDIFPTLDIPVVIVVWSYPGLSSEDMERLVVWRSERAYSSTVNGISQIESSAISGIGILKVYFEAGADIGAAIAQISSVSATAAHLMPPGINPPVVLQYNASNVPVAQMTVSSTQQSEQELFDYGLNFLRLRLFTVPGLATPAPYGGKQRQIMIDIDPLALAANNLAAQDVLNALLNDNLTVPAGSMRIGSLEYDVTINNSPLDVAGFQQLPLKTVGNTTVRLQDVASVHDSFAVQDNIVHVNGRRATYLSILKKANASTLAVVDASRALLPMIRASAPPDTLISLDFDQSVFVRAAIAGVVREALISSLLVSVMILLFLGSWRSVLIVCTSIPLAMCVTLSLLHWQQQTLNIMTLGGLALAIGMLVDDATVEVENIHRNRHLGLPLTVAIMTGAQQIATPALAATLTICIVFAPVVLLVGPARFLFTSLALSVVYSMLASYALSRTLVPALARLLMRSEHVNLQHAAPAAPSNAWEAFNLWRDRRFEAFTERYGRVLQLFLQHRGFVVAVFAALSFCAVFLAQQIGTDFFPEVDAGQMRLHVRAPLGTRIEETEHLVAQVEARIRQLIPAAELSSITDTIGVPTPYNLGFVQSDNTGGQDADVLIALSSAHQPTAQYRRALRHMLQDNFPTLHFYFQPADIISQVLNFGLSAPLSIDIESRQLDVGMQLARTLRDAMAKIPGIVDIRIPQGMAHPALRLDVDRLRAAQLGISQKAIANNLLTALSSSALVAPSYWLNPQNNVQYVVAVQTPLRQAHSVDDLLGTPLSADLLTAPPPANASFAAATYLGSVADLVADQSYALISHLAVQRITQVQCGVEGRDLGSVARAVQAAIDKLSLPPGVSVNIRGQSESMNSSFTALSEGLVLAAMLVYLLMVTLFQSWIDPLIIMFAVPGALLGVLLMLAVTQTTLNVESLMGTIMAVGVAVSNSILVVNFANESREEQPKSAFDAALLAGKTRLRPVLMTALAMILGMLPMALGAGEGGEQNAPLGRAVIGGLLVATCVTLFVVPVIYALLRQQPPRKGQLDAAFAREMELQPSLEAT